ncbi:ATP-binding protein [Agromyces terreus]|nr:ATP-binding protein [Agromyces terreus]
MDEGSLEEELKSALPIERSRAAASLMQDPHAVSTKSLVRAVQMETVPGIRRVLNEVLRLRQNTPEVLRVETSITDLRPVREQPAGALDIASLIRHELSPAVGWVRLAADGEIEDFDSSATNEAIQKLQRRVNGLVTLAKERGPANNDEIGIREALAQNWPHPSADLQIEGPPDGVEIALDYDLFSLLLFNVFQNAIDASMGAVGAATVSVVFGKTHESYWIRFSNPFDGNAFSLGDVIATGRSTKRSSRGQGLALINSIADQLDLRIDLKGQSGTAVFTLIGKL